MNIKIRLWDAKHKILSIQELGQDGREIDLFTGFTDENGENIFDKDFILDEENILYLVDWDEGAGRWWVWQQDESHGDGDHGFPMEDLNPTYNCLVMGNLHEGVDQEKLDKCIKDSQDN